jgi:hypothetical protein
MTDNRRRDKKPSDDRALHRRSILLGGTPIASVSAMAAGAPTRVARQSRSSSLRHPVSVRTGTVRMPTLNVQP